MPKVETLIVTKRYTVQMPDEDSKAFADLVERMVADNDDGLQSFARQVEAIRSEGNLRDAVALWMIEGYHVGNFTEVVQSWDYDIQKGTK